MNGHNAGILMVIGDFGNRGKDIVKRQVKRIDILIVLSQGNEFLQKITGNRQGWQGKEDPTDGHEVESQQHATHVQRRLPAR